MTKPRVRKHKPHSYNIGGECWLNDTAAGQRLGISQQRFVDLDIRPFEYIRNQRLWRESDVMTFLDTDAARAAGIDPMLAGGFVVDDSRRQQNAENRSTHGLTKHPLFDVCNYMHRYMFDFLCPAWRDLAVMLTGVEALGRRPSGRHQLTRLVEDYPLGPGNVTWELRELSAKEQRYYDARAEREGECLCDWQAMLNCPCPRGCTLRQPEGVAA